MPHHPGHRRAGRGCPVIAIPTTAAADLVVISSLTHRLTRSASSLSAGLHSSAAVAELTGRPARRTAASPTGLGRGWRRGGPKCLAGVPPYPIRTSSAAGIPAADTSSAVLIEIPYGHLCVAG